MVAHNNPISENHFRKDWQRFVKTWFNQPARQVTRRAARAAKATRVYPRPVNALRPVVRGQTVKYNAKARAGRGFTPDELRAAGVSPKKAAGLSITVDNRRKNRCEEGFNLNVDRLKTYMSKVVVLKKASDAAEYSQVKSKQTLAIVKPEVVQEFRAITEEERKAPSVANMLRQSHLDGKYWGQREKRIAKRATDKLASDKKAAKKSDD